jgi:ABC-2 type transport system permease protein
MTSRSGTTWLVAARELRQGLRSRSFRIVTALLVAAVAAAVLIPAAVGGRDEPDAVGVVGTVDPRTELVITTAARIAGVDVRPVSLGNLQAAEQGLRDGELEAVLIPGREVLIARTPAEGTTVSGAELSGALVLADGLVGGQAAEQKPSEDLPIRGLDPPLTDLSVRLTGLAVTIAIYMIILLYGSRISTAVSEEKASRVVEVLMAAVRPWQLLLGKVIGIGLLALGQALAILVTFVVLGSLVGSSLIRGASFEVVAVGTLWIVVGYIFYCTAYAAAGALVDKPSDAYNASMPVQVPLIVSYVLSFTVLYGTDVYGFYWFMAFFPPTAPVAMPVLVAIGVAQPWQVGVAVALSLVATVGMAWAAGRIYGQAILHSGSRLKLMQAIRKAG